jgi:2-isopropylmalate synthase
MGHPDAALVNHALTSNDKDHVSALEATLQCGGELVPIAGKGNGTIAAFTQAIEHLLDVTIEVRDYQQQTLSAGTDAKAVSYVKLSIGPGATWMRNFSRRRSGLSVEPS